jgi:predicted permease
MRGVQRALRRLLIKSVGPAVLADLEREIALRREARGSRWTEVLWLARVGFALAVRLRVAWTVRSGRRAFATFGTELGLAMKGLRRDPGLVLSAVVVLALGVAAPTAMYSVVDAQLRPLPFHDAQELVTVTYLTQARPSLGRGLTLEELRTLRDKPGVLGRVAAYEQVMWDVSGEGGEPERTGGARATYDILEILGEEAIRGRGFAEDDAEEAVAILGERLWRMRFGADPTLLGRSIRLNGEPHTIVGIVADHMQFPRGAQIWVPTSWSDSVTQRGPREYATVARLPSAVQLERADEQIRRALADVTTAGPREEGGGFAVSRLAPRLGDDARDGPIVLGWLALATCLLLIASANVANLFLCRAVSRHHDVAVRGALGAGRGRIVAMHLAEAAVVAVLGGIVGVVVAVRATQALDQAFTLEGSRWWRELQVDPGMLWFAFGLIVSAALMAGVVPALRTANGDVGEALKGDSRSGGALHLGRLSQALVVTEVMLSVALVVQASLSSVPLLDLPGAFEAREVLAAGYTLRPEERESEQELIAFHRALLDRVAARPGVTESAILAPLPGQFGWEGDVLPSGHALQEAERRDGTQIVRVSPGVFDVLGVPLLRGRDLTWADGETAAPVILVNEAYAQRYLAGQDPLGSQVTFKPPNDEAEVGATIVGVAPTLGVLSREGDHPDAVYIPIAMSLPTDAYLIVGAAPGEGPLSLLPEVRTTLASLDPDKPLHSVGTPQSLYRYQMGRFYSMAGLFGVIGLVGLLMAATGLFSVMAFTVRRRTREAGIRVALGASSVRVVWVMLAPAARRLGEGLLLGFVLALAARPRVPGAPSVFEEPGILAVVATVLIATGLLAAIVPALRAVRVEPTVALRAN